MFEFSLFAWLLPEHRSSLSRCAGDFDATGMAAGHTTEVLSELSDSPCLDGDESSPLYSGFRPH
jgi:hypothetical protein